MADVHLNIDEYLQRAQVAIDNALANADVLGYLADYGYTAERIQAGQTLYRRALELQQKQKAEYGDQFAATDALRAAWDKASAIYIQHIKVARVALKGERGAAQELDLDGTRKQSLGGWLAQARQFYAAILANETIQAKLAEFGLTVAKLQAGQAQVLTVESMNLAQEKEVGEAQDATQARDAALDELAEWMSDYVAIARVALEPQPQLLEKLDILARSE
jgi:hypothetical protein